MTDMPRFNLWKWFGCLWAGFHHDHTASERYAETKSACGVVCSQETLYRLTCCHCGRRRRFWSPS